MRVILALMTLLLVGCEMEKSIDTVQREQQEVLLKEATSAVGMPAIHNFRERKILKDILELRDQDGLVTFTYIFNELNGTLVFLGESIGYGIPYATQFTNPEKLERVHKLEALYEVLPQADPNGLYSPAAAEGTWILMKDPKGSDVKPVYVEARVIVSPFRLL
jgi:hypothetical protein